MTDRLQDVGPADTGLDRVDRVGREAFAQYVLDLALERLAAEAGALLLGRLLQLLDLPAHLLERDLLLV